MKRTIRVLAALAVCAAAPAQAEENVATWPPLPASELVARRAGLRVGGLDLSVDVWIRDDVDGTEPAPGINVLVGDLGGLGVLAHLVNHVDNVRIQRDAEIRLRIDGFNAVFGSPALRAARARLRDVFE